MSSSDRHFPYRGTLVWLTSEQGGRRTGPPDPRDDWPHYAANAWLPPRTATDGLRSVVLRGFTRDAWTSAAEACWLVELENYPEVVSGSVLVISEGPRTVGFFTVDQVAREALSGP